MFVLQSDWGIGKTRINHCTVFSASFPKVNLQSCLTYTGLPRALALHKSILFIPWLLWSVNLDFQIAKSLTLGKKSWVLWRRLPEERTSLPSSTFLSIAQCTWCWCHYKTVVLDSQQDRGIFLRGLLKSVLYAIFFLKKQPKWKTLEFLKLKILDFKLYFYDIAPIFLLSCKFFVNCKACPSSNSWGLKQLKYHPQCKLLSEW